MCYFAAILGSLWNCRIWFWDANVVVWDFLLWGNYFSWINKLENEKVRFFNLPYNSQWEINEKQAFLAFFRAPIFPCGYRICNIWNIGKRNSTITRFSLCSDLNFVVHEKLYINNLCTYNSSKHLSMTTTRHCLFSLKYEKCMTWP